MQFTFALRRDVKAGQLPRELARLTRLTTLVMSNNYLEGPLPADLGTLGRLKELDLSMNDITGEISQNP